MKNVPWNMKTTIVMNPFNLLELSDNRINAIMILIQGTLSLKICEKIFFI